MTNLEVSPVVESILAAFQNGMEVFVRIRRRKPGKHGKLPRMNQDELKLHTSLSNRPKDIQAEYNSSVFKYGQRFTRGDNTAYSSLAHTLLVLNTGLINLINSALSSDVTDRSKSYQNLLMLSESAATNTIQTLSQLNSRLSISPRRGLLQGQERVIAGIPKQSSEAVQKVEPIPSPLLARGGWVRTKSGWSVVSAKSAKKLTAQANGNQRSKSLPINSAIASDKPDDLFIDSLRYYDTVFTNSCQHLPRVPESECVRNIPLPNPIKEDERPPSMLLVPATYFQNHSIISEDSNPPPRPPKIPLHARSITGPRARPLSAATFMTTSTKIGEIPEFKWGDRPLQDEEREQLPLPYIIPPPLEPPRRKKRGFKFWKNPKLDEMGY